MSKPKAKEKVRLFPNEGRAVQRKNSLANPAQIVPVKSRHQGRLAYYLMQWFSDDKIGVLCIDGKWRYARDAIFPDGVQ